jgi:two-component system, OmpR family, response regulator
MQKQKGIKILLVEDDLNLGFVVKDSLEMNGYQVVLHTNGNDAFQAVFKEPFDIAVLDVMLPQKDGFTLANEIRNEGNDLPIIFLTAKAMEFDRIKGFKMGADDYITKPFSMEEFLLRLEAVLKRCQLLTSEKPEQNDFSIGKFYFNYPSLTLDTGDTKISLTSKEASVLKLLCQNKNEVVKREVALKIIWGSDDYFLGRSMDVFITKLRKHLKGDSTIKIINVHGVGFMLTEAK